MLANQMGLTSQVPMVYEVVTNKATKDYRETMMAKTRVIIRKPRVEVTETSVSVYVGDEAELLYVGAVSFLLSGSDL